VEPLSKTAEDYSYHAKSLTDCIIASMFFSGVLGGISQPGPNIKPPEHFFPFSITSFVSSYTSSGVPVCRTEGLIFPMIMSPGKRINIWGQANNF
jgi:hypothetical protein